MWRAGGDVGRASSQRESTNSLDDMMVDENPSGSTSRWMYGGSTGSDAAQMYFDHGT